MKRQVLKEGEKGDRDLWEFPGSSASDDPLASRHEIGSTRVKSRNAGGDTVNLESSRGPDRKQSCPIKETFETHDTLVHDGKSTESTKLHGTDPLAGTSFKIDLTDPTLILTASQKEQYQQVSTTTSTAGSLPSPLPDEPSFIYPYGKFSDASSTIPNSTPSKQVQAGVAEISPFPGTKHSPDMSVPSVAMQTPSQPSQTGSKSSQTPRRSKSTLGLQSPGHDKSTSSRGMRRIATSISTPMPKRRSRTTTSVSSQCPAEEVALVDLSLPVTVLDITNTTAQKTTKKRKAKDVDELGSDDIAIGLPKEQYKPRPSRSRGNTNLDGLLESVDFSKRPEAQVKAKNKRRKTHELNVPKTTDEAVRIQESRETGEDITEQAVGTKNSVVIPPDIITIHEKDTVEIVDNTTQPPQKPINLKRKLPTDDTTAHETNTEDAHPQTEPKVPTSPKPTQPAPKARGRPRKKTNEKPLSIPITDKTLPVTTDPPKPDLQPQHLPQHDDKTNPVPDSVLEETDPNSNAAPSGGGRVQRPSTPPPERATTTGTTPPPATPSQKTTDPPKGPQKHSPLNGGRVPYRVGLSKRARIEPLLRGFRK